MKQLTDLVLKAYENGLSIDISDVGNVYVWHITRDGSEVAAATIVTQGSLDSLIHSKADVLERMHHEVDQFLKGVRM